jgi:hypothetical protein
MTIARMFPALAIALCLALPAFAQTPSKSLAARVTTLEKENAALREDVDRLEKLLTQTRRDMLTVQAARIGGGAYVAPPLPGATVEPLNIPQQQAQTDAAIRQQNTQTQLNNLQLQQQMMQDRQREQQLFQPQTYGPPR